MPGTRASGGHRPALTAFAEGWNTAVTWGSPWTRPIGLHDLVRAVLDGALAVPQNPRRRVVLVQLLLAARLLRLSSAPIKAVRFGSSSLSRTLRTTTTTTETDKVTVKPRTYYGIPWRPASGPATAAVVEGATWPPTEPSTPSRKQTARGTNCRGFDSRRRRRRSLRQNGSAAWSPNLLGRITTLVPFVRRDNCVRTRRGDLQHCAFATLLH